MLFGVSIQPSELSKLALIVFIAGEIGAHPEKLKDFYKGIVPILSVLALLWIILFFMPNYSAIICIALLVFCLLVVGGVDKKFLIGVGIFGAIAILAFIALEPYRVGRFIALSDPFSDSTEAAYQLRNSLYSVSSGGLFGRGLGQSVQKLSYLPLPESDFIFAIICEELGFIGAMFTLSLYGIVVWRGVLIALRAPDLTGTLIATGVVSIIAIQVVINVGVVLGVLPSTGVVLPFISYGGSAIVSFIVMIGLLLNVSRQTVRAVKVHQSVYESGHDSLPASNDSAHEQPRKRRLPQQRRPQPALHQQRAKNEPQQTAPRPAPSNDSTRNPRYDSGSNRRYEHPQSPKPAPRHSPSSDYRQPAYYHTVSQFPQSMRHKPQFQTITNLSDRK